MYVAPGGVQLGSGCGSFEVHSTRRLVLADAPVRRMPHHPVGSHLSEGHLHDQPRLDPYGAAPHVGGHRAGQRRCGALQRLHHHARPDQLGMREAGPDMAGIPQLASFVQGQDQRRGWTRHDVGFRVAGNHTFLFVVGPADTLINWRSGCERVCPTSPSNALRPAQHHAH